MAKEVTVKSENDGLYISQVAKIIGVSASTIRAWENSKLITPKRSPSGYRTYDAGDLQRLTRIRELIHTHKYNPAAVLHHLTDDNSSEPHDSIREGVTQDSTSLRHQLRVMRRQQGMTLRELSKATGLSASTLSAVERGASVPSVETLRRLAGAFATTVPELLGLKATTSNIVHPHERQEMDLGIPGVRYESLSGQSPVLQAMMIYFEAGAGSDELYMHDGEEFLYVMGGTLQLAVEGVDVDLLFSGDAATYPSTKPHRLRNPEKEGVTEVLWVQTPPSI